MPNTTSLGCSANPGSPQKVRLESLPCVWRTDMMQYFAHAPPLPNPLPRFFSGPGEVVPRPSDSNSVSAIMVLKRRGNCTSYTGKQNAGGRNRDTSTDIQCISSLVSKGGKRGKKEGGGGGGRAKREKTDCFYSHPPCTANVHSEQEQQIPKISQNRHSKSAVG